MVDSTKYIRERFIKARIVLPRSWRAVGVHHIADKVKAAPGLALHPTHRSTSSTLFMKSPCPKIRRCSSFV
ncbi:hypothetical protein E2C01_035861 [Portunus trituberculatus]|uniref:Uncharacterized protein n=1 Tax=Portunus trituberculatus TaxID=210409 RepID=A0A5B7FCL6_PORTR|nr:hypothetical protein [Portunus trituberculatus]